MSFDALELRGAVLDAEGCVLVASQPFQDIAAHIFTGDVERLVLRDDKCDGQFARALKELVSARPAAAPIAIPLPTHENMPPILLHLAAADFSHLSPAQSGLLFLVVTVVGHKRVPDKDVLQGLFNLTKSEARLAYEVGQGASLKRAAEKFSISEKTARTVLKRIFAKTGVARQSELAAILASLSFRL